MVSGSQTGGPQTNNPQNTGTGGGEFPVSNFIYDCVTLMHEKLKGLEALQKYEQDAQQGGHQRFAQLLQTVRQNDTQCVKELEQILASNLKGQ